MGGMVARPCVATDPHQPTTPPGSPGPSAGCRYRPSCTSSAACTSWVIVRDGRPGARHARRRPRPTTRIPCRRWPPPPRRRAEDSRGKRRELGCASGVVNQHLGIATARLAVDLPAGGAGGRWHPPRWGRRTAWRRPDRRWRRSRRPGTDKGSTSTALRQAGDGSRRTGLDAAVAGDETAAASARTGQAS